MRQHACAETTQWGWRQTYRLRRQKDSRHYVLLEIGYMPGDARVTPGHTAAGLGRWRMRSKNRKTTG